MRNIKKANIVKWQRTISVIFMTKINFYVRKHFYRNF